MVKRWCPVGLIVPVLVVLSLPITACAGRLSVPPEVKVLRDIAYGKDEAQKMDVYQPVAVKGAPVIFMVHGGGWRNGDKGLASVVRNKLAYWTPRGFIFISVNYRMLPDADPLTQADDVARALAVAQKRAAEWGGDPDKFILMGHSAGAHLVSLLNAAPERAGKQGARPWLGTVSLDTAGTNIVQVMERDHLRLYDDAFGKNRDYWESASPWHVLTAQAKPILLVCSTQRRDKPCEQMHEFAARAKRMGLRVEVLGQAKSHREINVDLGLPGAYTDAVERFMASLDPRVKRLLASKP